MTTTIEIALPQPSEAQDASTIASDEFLESQYSPSRDYYIGALETTEEGGTRLPVRLAPSAANLNNGWEDKDFTYIDTAGQLDSGATDSYRPDQLSIGTPITITEIVNSGTGVWVGFVYDDMDQEELDQGPGRLVYTLAQYIRVKKSAPPHPHISNKIIPGRESQTATLPGTSLIEPAYNQNWLKLRPNDVRLSYYDFYVHNVKTFGDKLVYNSDFIEANPVARYTEGYYYFILGELPRKSEEQVSDESLETSGSNELNEEELEEAKKQSSGQVYSLIKQEAWKNLLDYLGKNIQGGDQKLRDELYEKYFVIAGSKVNTSSANPNNQKVLFAIRASYIDALPDTRKYYGKNFPDEGEWSEFKTGKNYAITFSLKEIKTICIEIASILKKIKSKIKSSKKKITNLNGTDYDINIQIEVIEDLPRILNDFLFRQTFPGSTNLDFVMQMLGEGIETKHNHLIQLGIKDNNIVGPGVRETLSYVLFSPDPESLKSADTKNFNLFQFDPYLTEEETKKQNSVKRSATALKIALPKIRADLAGVYGSRALHLLLSYNNIKSLLANEKQSVYDEWPEFLIKYSVPPMKIYLSDDPAQADHGKLDCDELIKQLNSSGPNVGIEEKLIQEQIYNSPECMEKYFNQFKDDTPATAPGLSKKDLEKSADEIETGIDGDTKAAIKILYTGFFNSLDPESLISLILACIQKKLGLPLTAEAICEAAIIQLLNSLGIEAIEKVMMVNAMLNIENPNSQAVIRALGSAPHPSVTPEDSEYSVKLPSATAELNLDGAPVATALLRRADYNKDGYVTKEEIDQYQQDITLIEIVKSLEKSGAFVALVPAPGYQREIIDSERDRLLELGYTKKEANAVLVDMGLLVLSEDINQNSERLDIGGLDLGPVGPPGRPPERIREFERDAQNWLAWMKRVIDLQGICELIVGDILQGLEDLIKDPGAFLSNFGEGWWEDFVENLKRQFSFPVPTMSFPDSLTTDSHMGDFAEQILKSILSAIAMVLGQIVQMIIREALDKCLEENDDLGPAPNPVTSPRPIPLPVIQRIDLPTIGELPDADIVSWMKDIMDQLKNASQLCSLLRGDAGKQLLYDCLTRTKAFWPDVYASGVDTIYQIRVIFEKIGKELNLEICDVLEPSSPVVDDICKAVLNSDARCEQLQKAGLTKEECDTQIEREIEDLKQKVLGLSELAFPQTNPLNSVPTSPCAANGGFQIPPGVEDTMSRVTDNMLTNVKGSLMRDLSALKFFSMPPRAILAASDADEMTKAQQMFVDAIKDPYKVPCLAYVGPPQYDFDGSINFFPITYNRWLHYGDHSTKWGVNRVAGVVFDQEETDDLGDVDLKQDTQDLLSKYSGNHKDSDTIFDQNALIPIDIGPALGDYKLYTDNASATATVAGLLQELGIQSTQHAAAVSFHANENYSDLVDLIDEKFNNQIKSVGLDKLVFPPRLLTRGAGGRGYGTLKGPCAEWDDVGKDYLRKGYSLDTKLKNIHPDPRQWYPLLRAYTGCNIKYTEGEDQNTNSTYNLSIGYRVSEDEDGKPSVVRYKNIVLTSGRQRRWLMYSPGYYNLFKILHSKKELYFKVYDVLNPATGAVTSAKEYHSIAFAFMELTVKEALGLENERIRKIFPKFVDVENIIDGVVFAHKRLVTRGLHSLSEAGQEDRQTTSTGGGAGNAAAGMVPLYAVFRQVFRDPKSPLSAPPDEMINYFSLKDDPVSPELVDSLESSQDFVVSFDRDADLNDIRYDMSLIENYKNFNPNIILYDMPFTEVSVVGMAGKHKTQEILNILSGKYGASEEVSSLISSIQNNKGNESLLHQNALSPLLNNETLQKNSIMDISKVAKGGLRSSFATNTPPSMVANENSFINDSYNFSFVKKFDPDVEGLINNLYDGDFSFSSVNNEYNSFLNERIQNQREYLLGNDYISADHPYRLNENNLQAQIFGKFLKKKFIEKFDQYIGTPFGQVNEERLQAMLSTYCYSGLQFAYSHQAFTKLKNSRLHKRKFMKKLWNKILRSPLNSNKVDPECREAFDQLGITSQTDLDTMETDFFNLEDIKPKIMEMYKNSLCKDIYEGTQEESSAKKSLFNGVVKLIIKIYSLELCLASVIAWDSFDISDVFNDDLITKIIVKNLKEDFDINVLSHYANEIIKNEPITAGPSVSSKMIDEYQKNPFALLFFLNQSALEYLIARESKSIANAVKSIFNFGSPLSTNLQLDVLKNSDPDFVNKYQKAFPSVAGVGEDPSVLRSKVAEVFEVQGLEYVADVKLRNNIYTMNYGGRHTSLAASSVPNDMSNEESFDLFGINSLPGNKSKFHSIPMTFNAGISEGDYFEPQYTGQYIGAYEEQAIPHLRGTHFGNAQNPSGLMEGPTAKRDHKTIYDAQRIVLGHADAFGKENFQEVLYGNEVNAKFGNITIQPYVRVEEIQPADLKNYNVTVFVSDGQVVEPCEEASTIIFDASDYVGDMMNHLNEDIRQEHRNVFNCHMFGYIPLSAWSYFYNNLFMRHIENVVHEETGIKPLKEIFNKYGLRAFFSKVSYGLRLSYSTAFPTKGIGLDGVMQDIYYGNAAARDGLKKVKSLYNHRPYMSGHKSVAGKLMPAERSVLTELQIPIVEVEKEINSIEASQSITFGDGKKIIPVSELGSYHDFPEPSQVDFKYITQAPGALESLVNNPQQFFYKNVAPGLLRDLKNTPEFKLMFDHLLPMRRYMALGFLYAGEGMSKFIPEPTDVLDETKNTLKMLLEGLLNSDDFKYLPPSVANSLEEFNLRKDGGTRGLESDVTKQMLMILLKAPLMVLKGFVEATDPAVIMARKIVEIANAIAQTTFAAMDTGLRVTKAVQDGIASGAEASMMNLEITAQLASSTLTTLKNTLPSDIQGLITISTPPGNVGSWEISAGEPTQQMLNQMSDKEKQDWEKFQESFEELKIIIGDYQQFESDYTAAKTKADEIQETINQVKEDAEEVFNSIFNSPFLVPGLWASLMPGMIPFGGGIVPPPFPGGPFPSTVPGMIYIALLLIDAIEEKTHDDTHDDASDCEEQL